MEKEPVVAISCCTYNQKDFIAQCLEGFVMQKTNFPFVAIVADDCSTDGTREIVKEYAEKYPDIIKPILREKNIGPVANSSEVYDIINSKYICICDGDDYWTSQYKLQKQVDFLESHPDYTVCYHKVKMVFENSRKSPKIIPIKADKNPQSFRKLLKGGYIPSNSVMYRFEYLQKELKNYPKDIYPGDWFNHIVIGKYGKIGFIKEVMSVYRRNEQSVSYTSGKDHEKELHKKYGIQEMNFFYEVWQRIKDIYPEYYKEMFLPNLRDIYFTYLQMGDFEKLEILKNNYSQYFKDMESSTGIASKKHKKYKKLFNILLIINIVLAVFMLGLALLYLLNAMNVI